MAKHHHKHQKQSSSKPKPSKHQAHLKPASGAAASSAADFPSLSSTVLRGDASESAHHGLTNLGNTCYMNAVLQCLCALDVWRSVLGDAASTSSAAAAASSASTARKQQQQQKQKQRRAGSENAVSADERATQSDTAAHTVPDAAASDAPHAHVREDAADDDHARAEGHVAEVSAAMQAVSLRSPVSASAPAAAAASVTSTPSRTLSLRAAMLPPPLLKRGDEEVCGDGPLFTAFSFLFQEMARAGKQTCATRPFFDRFSARFGGLFDARQQQDAHEFMWLLMEALDAEERESRESRGRPRAAHTAPTFIDRTFRGRSATLTCCRVCHECSVVYESFRDLMLSMPEAVLEQARRAAESAGDSTRGSRKQREKRDRRFERARARMLSEHADDEGDADAGGEAADVGGAGAVIVFDDESGGEGDGGDSGAAGSAKSNALRDEAWIRMCMGDSAPGDAGASGASGAPAAASPAAATAAPVAAASASASAGASATATATAPTPVRDAVASPAARRAPGSTQPVMVRVVVYADACVGGDGSLARRVDAQAPAVEVALDMMPALFDTRLLPEAPSEMHVMQSLRALVTPSDVDTSHSTELKCGNCHSTAGDFVQSLRLLELPPVLVLTIKRFFHGSKRGYKLASHVDFPLELDMTPFVRGAAPLPRLRVHSVTGAPTSAEADARAAAAVSESGASGAGASTAADGAAASSTPASRRAARKAKRAGASASGGKAGGGGGDGGGGDDDDDGSVWPWWDGESDALLQYELIGVVEHAGGLGSGHYTSFVRRRGQWFACNDAKVRPATMHDVRSANAYLLVYRRTVNAE